MKMNSIAEFPGRPAHAESAEGSAAPFRPPIRKSGEDDRLAADSCPPGQERTDKKTRPSTELRRVRLRALVAMFSEREIGYVEVARLLTCSASAARNYIFELMDAGVVSLSPNRGPAGGLDRSVYRISADRRIVDEFQAGLEKPLSCKGSRTTSALRHCDEAPDALPVRTGAQSIPCALDTSTPAARRDPLVAALFGAPCARSESRS
ncbi:MAG: hypothetical protein WA191_21950 [Telluria sp.]|nr:hypothetical protein [Telluria sp.]